MIFIDKTERQHLRALFLVALIVLSLPAMSSGAIANPPDKFSGTQEQLLTDDTTDKLLELNPDTASEEENGTVYVGSDDNTVYAIDSETGEQEWAYDAGNQIRSSPTVSDGVVFVGSKEYVDDEGDNLHAIDADTGKKEWAVDIGAIVDSSPTIARGSLYVKDSDGRLYSINPNNGEKIWQYSTDDGGISESAPTVANGMVYFGSHDNNLYAIDAETGEKEWSYETNGDVESSPIVESGIVYVGSYDSNLYAIDAETGEKEWSYETGNSIRSSPIIADGLVYFGSDDSDLYAVDAETGEFEWRGASDVGSISSSPTVADGIIYVGTTEENLYAIDAETGNDEWVYNANERIRSSPTVADGAVYIGTYDHDLVAVETETGEQRWSHSTGNRVYSSPTFVSDDSDFSDGSRVDNRALGHHDGSSFTSEVISGKAVDQSGNPIENASVVASGLTEDVLDEEYDDPEAELNDIEDELDEIKEDLEVGFPEDYTALLDVESEIGEEYETTYPVIHTADQWDLNSNSYLGDRVHTRTSVEGDLDEPRINVGIHETVVLSLWDPNKQSTVTFGPIGDDVVDENLYGGTTSGTIVVEQIQPTGEVSETQTLDTQDFFEVTSTRNVGTKTHEAATYSFSEGFYRIYPEGNEEVSYVIVAGSAQRVVDRFERGIEDEKDELTEKAKQIEDYAEQGAFFVEEVRTDSDGTFEIEVPKNAHEAELEAYKGEGQILDDVDEPTLDDLLDLKDDGYDGTFYIPIDGPETVDPPAEGVTLELHRVNYVPGQGLSGLNDLIADRANSFFDRTAGFLTTRGDQLLSEIDAAQFEQRWEDRIESFEELTDADLGSEDVDWDDISGINEDDVFDDDGNPLPPDEIDGDAEEILEEIEDELESTAEPDDHDSPLPDPGWGGDDDSSDPIYSPSPPGDSDDDDDAADSPITIDDDGLLNIEYPLPSGVDEENIMLDLHWSDGTTETLDEEYWSVEESGRFFDAQRQLVVEDYPVDESDPATLTVDLRIVDPGEDDREGGIIDEDIPIQNPAFTGEIPAANVNLNTLSPGPDERVTVDLRPEDHDEFGSLEELEVFDPDGNEIEGEVTGDSSANFRTVGDGVYHVRTTFTDATGEAFVQSFRIDAGESGLAQPATVRAESSAFGTFAIVGEGIEDARITDRRQTTSMVAVLPATSDSPGEIYLKPQRTLSGTSNTLDVSVVQGADEQTVNNNIGIVVHLDSHTDGALHWQNGDPITWGGDTRFGEVQERGGDTSDKHVIRTYTDSDGQVKIEIDEDPGWVDRLSHWWSVRMIGIPFLSIGFGELLGGLVGTGLSVVLWRGKRRLIG
jgi:outer membrane protein assembly factor BamB